jgi:hypothetical protein
VGMRAVCMIIVHSQYCLIKDKFKIESVTLVLFLCDAICVIIVDHFEHASMEAIGLSACPKR